MFVNNLCGLRSVTSNVVSWNLMRRSEKCEQTSTMKEFNETIFQTKTRELQ